MIKFLPVIKLFKAYEKDLFVVAGEYLYCLANTSLRIFLNDKTGSLDGIQDPVVLKYKLSSDE